jgi:DNA-directed RNA polymerase subunit RPC12/RpoP
MAGHEFSYKCKYCEYEEYYKQGHGYLVRPQSFQEYKSTNQKLFHYEIHNKIVRLSKEYPGLAINATFQVYKCPKCNLLHNKVQVSLTEGEKSLHLNRFKCTKCRSRLRLTNIHRLKKATCPVCGKPGYRRQNLHDRLWEK